LFILSSETHASNQQQSQSAAQSPLTVAGGVGSSSYGVATGSGSNSGVSSASVIQHQSGKSSPALGALGSSSAVGGNTGGNLTATTTESGNLKISFEKQTTRVQQLQEQEASPARRSR